MPKLTSPLGHERHRNRGADRVSGPKVNGLARCSAEDARLAPIFDYVQRSKMRSYSITWSARCSSDGGIVRPRALAVLRLMSSSSLVGRSMGRSAGLTPLRILST